MITIRDELSRGRYLIAMDRHGVYIRRTLAVIHRLEIDKVEVHYHTVPVTVSKAPWSIRKLYIAACKERKVKP